jgi:hypothetical protein
MRFIRSKNEVRLAAWLRIIAAFCLWLSLCLPSWAVTYYVRMTGNDANNGTSAATAYKTIDKAANSAHAGDTIYVGAGVYAGSDLTPTNNGTLASPIVCIGDTTGAFTGDAGVVEFQKQVNLGAKDYWQLIGLTIDNNAGKYGIITTGTLGLVVQNCTISGVINAVEITGTTTGTISGCTIFGCSDNGIDISASGASSIITISNCILKSNTKSGLYAKKATVTATNCLITGNAQHGIWDDNDAATIVNIWNCTISDNSQEGLKVSGGTTTIKNCAVTYNATKGLSKAGGTLNTSYNDVYSNTTGNYNGVSAGTGDISSDPKYLDRTNGDYSIYRGSPMTDAATSASGTVDDDLNGRPRPLGSAWDMGCYESAPNGNVLLVATSTASPTANETARKTLIQSFGCYVTLIDDDASQATFDSALLNNDVAYVSVDAVAASVGTKLANTAVGVVNENANLADEFGIASTTMLGSGTTLTRNDTGNVTIFSSSQTTVSLAGTVSIDIQVRGKWGSDSGYNLLEGGSRRYNSGYVVGRRVQLPWGGSTFATSMLAQSGKDLMKEAILWAGGCIGRWSLDETSGTTATDTSGKNGNGALTSGVTFSSNSIAPAKLINGLDFDGTDDYIAVPNSRFLQPSSALSISAWVKGDSWPNSAKVILRKGGANPNNYQLAIYNGKVSLVLDASDATGIVGTTTLATGVWYHVVATWDGTTAKIYVNSALDNSPGATRTGAIGTDFQSVYLGGRPSGGSTNTFDGALDDIRIFNYALEQWEVTNLNYVGQLRGLRILTWVEVQ